MGAEVALLFLNGEPSFHTFWEDVKRNRERYVLLAADGGVRELGEGLLPDLLLGDMDSLSIEEVRFYEEQGAPMERHPVMKDKTDGQLILERALSLGLKEVIFFGALGKRMDQTLASIHLLYQALKNGLLASIVSPREILFGGERELTFHAPLQTPFSLLSLTPKVSGLTIRGSLYDIDGGELLLGDTLGLSNRVLRPPVSIESKEGIFLLIVERRGEGGEIYRVKGHR